MEENSILKNPLTNQNYRKILVDSAIDIMNSNEREYNKQTNPYINKDYMKKEVKRNYK